MRNFYHKPLKSALLLAQVAAVLFVAAFFMPGKRTSDPATCVREAEAKLVELEREMFQELDRIDGLKTEKELSGYFTSASKQKPGFTFYLLQGDNKQYWSDNEPAISDSAFSSFASGEMLRLPNGDFLAYRKTSATKKIIGLLLIKHSYEYENKYLVNRFNRTLSLGKGFSVSDTGIELHAPNGKLLFKLAYDANAEDVGSDAATTLYFLCLLFILLSSHLFLYHHSTSSGKSLFVVLFLILLRTLMIYFKFPAELYSQGIFSPSYYASSFYFNSLGDMLLNGSFLLMFSISLYSGIKKPRRKIILLPFAGIVFAVIVHILIRGLIINSRISFDLSAPSNVNIYSILAFTSISILLLSFLYLIAAILRRNSGYTITGRHAWIGISVCALYTAIALSGMNAEKERDTRKLLAQKAEMRQDHIAEYLFKEQEEKIASDPDILNEIHSGAFLNEKLASVISQKYLTGYLSKYQLTLQVIDMLNTHDSEVILDYYLRQAEQGIPTGSDRLFFLKSETGRSSYLSIIPLHEENHRHTVILVMTSQFLQSEKGFPELFISGNFQETNQAEEYSFARYNKNALLYEFGDYVYPLTARDFPQNQQEYGFHSLNGYSHLIYRINPDSFIIISLPEKSFLGVLTLFSWMFTFMSASAFLLFLLSGLFTAAALRQWNLTRRVQASVIFLVVLAFVLVGSGTVYYINIKYAAEQNKSISDQVNAVWFMVRENLDVSPDNEIRDTIEITRQLDLLVKNTNIDFNIFDATGKMFYSSQPKIFNKGIVSSRMNPEAYFTIRDKGLTQFIHPERAGLLKFIAAYAPFTDGAGHITAFLNLPYLEKQNELNKEVSVFLSALVNIYVLLFAIAVIVTIFISSQITRPLLLIQEKMSGIRLGATNEKIEYRERDEIGQLVHEYNRMIDELSVSAEKLASSERESAWREMAKQVAHEIKNPLTPMKLSVQHLHRTFKDRVKEDDQAIDRITNTLIQQIDTLSNIATAFSNFAKMPQPNRVKTDLIQLIRQVSELYNEGAEIKIAADETAYIVTADKDQLIGVFSNLIKNAIQSIPPERKGLVTISLRRRQGQVEVEIADNGNGIPEDQTNKIFTPNFTTKSSGMGLGLAIVRNIVEEANGKIWFTTTYGTGSSFFISLPLSE